MKSYRVKMSPAALADIDHLSDYLVSIMSVEGSWRYKEAMKQEILSLSVFCWAISTESFCCFAAHPSESPQDAFP